MNLEVLSNDQKQVFDVLSKVAFIESFYLAGGTAVALTFGHRTSEDFDWFIQNIFDDLLLSAS